VISLKDGEPRPQEAKGDEGKSGEESEEVRRPRRRRSLRKKVEELSTEVEELRDALKREKERAEGYLERLMRLQAEFENYRKRIDREREEHIRMASERVVSSLIDVSENLERAVDAAEKARGRKAVKSLLEGVKMTLGQLNEVLAREGLTRIEAVGKPFDPRFHEAVTRVESDEHPENVVVQEFMRGYMLNSRVIRPAKVAVSCGQSKAK